MVWHLRTLLDKCVGKGRRGREERERQRDGREGKSDGERQKRE